MCQPPSPFTVCLPLVAGPPYMGLSPDPFFLLSHSDYSAAAQKKIGLEAAVQVRLAAPNGAITMAQVGA